MRAPLNPCYFLHLRPYRETSLLADVFSRDHGRLTLVARGARRPASRSAGLYQPMCPLLLAWTQRGEMGTLSGIEAAGTAQPPTGRRLIAGFYLNELLVRLLHRHEAHPELFHAYALALDSLAAGRREEPTLRVFEKQLLLSLGYGLVLDHEADSGRPLDSGAGYFYVRGRGPVRTPSGVGDDIPVSGAALLALHAETLDDAEQGLECKRLLRALLADQLDGRPLASRALYRQYSTGMRRA